MNALWWVLIVAAAVVVVAIVAYAAWRQSRTRSLKSTFGSEYDRATSDVSRREGESDLAARRKHREELDIRPLPEASRDRYLSRWEAVQARFVDDPEGAVGEADNLIQQVMSERGYPVDDFEQRAADVSVDYPDVVENYRRGHALATSREFGDSRTEDLRHAMRHYRALFEELIVTEREPEEARR